MTEQLIPDLVRMVAGIEEPITSVNRNRLLPLYRLASSLMLEEVRPEVVQVYQNAQEYLAGEILLEYELARGQEEAAVENATVRYTYFTPR